MTELADLMDGSMRRAQGELERIARDVALELRAETNALVMAQAREIERRNLAAELTTSSGALRRSKAVAWSALASVLAVLAGWITDRWASADVEGKAEAAAATVIEQRATPIEQRATEAATAAQTTDARTAQIAARQQQLEGQLERVLQLLEAQASAPKGRR